MMVQTNDSHETSPETQKRPGKTSLSNDLLGVKSGADANPEMLRQLQDAMGLYRQMRNERGKLRVALRNVERLRQYLAKASFSSGVDRHSALECLTEIEHTLEAKTGEEEVACPACCGSGWMVRDPDIGTDQECFVCEGSRMTPEISGRRFLPVSSDDVLAGRRTMNLETHILLRCPTCKNELEVERVGTDYPEAVRVEVTCPECNAGDFAETMHYDQHGKHITRDPSLPAND